MKAFINTSKLSAKTTIFFTSGLDNEFSGPLTPGYPAIQFLF